MNLIKYAIKKKAFGQSVRFFRKEKGWSQEDLAHAAGLHRTHISIIERGQQNLTLDVIYKLADVLEIQTSKLFET